MRDVRDNREVGQIKLFDLKEPHFEHGFTEFKSVLTKKGRTGYTPDAFIMVDGQKHYLELKTHHKETHSIATARNFTLGHLDIYKSVFLIISEFIGSNSVNYKFTGKHFIIHHSDISEWFEKTHYKILHGSSKYGGLLEWEMCREILLNSSMDDSIIERLDYSFVKRGCSINCPTIPTKLVEKNGMRINCEDDIKTYIRKIVKSEEKESSKCLEKSHKFFIF